jgi:hypothetical protein
MGTLGSADGEAPICLAEFVIIKCRDKLMEEQHVILVLFSDQSHILFVVLKWCDLGEKHRTMSVPECKNTCFPFVQDTCEYTCMHII